MKKYFSSKAQAVTARKLRDPNGLYGVRVLKTHDMQECMQYVQSWNF